MANFLSVPNALKGGFLGFFFFLLLSEYLPSMLMHVPLIKLSETTHKDMKLGDNLGRGVQ